MTEIKFPTDPNDLTPTILTAAMSVDRPGLVVQDLEVVEAFYAANGQASTADRVILHLDYSKEGASGHGPSPDATREGAGSSRRRVHLVELRGVVEEQFAAPRRRCAAQPGIDLLAHVAVQADRMRIVGLE